MEATPGFSDAARLLPGGERPEAALPPVTPEDERRAAEIRALLAADPEIEGTPIDVTVRDGVAEVSGVARAYVRAAAQRIAGTAEGIRAVRNRVRIQDPWALTDADIRSLVASALEEIDAVRGGRVTVSVDNRIITLAGVAATVGERAEIARIAGEVAAELPPPVELRNAIAVGAGSAAAADIRTRIEDALIDDLRQSISALSITLTGETVMLEGVLPDGGLAQRAAMAALEIPGVSHVDNRIRVRAGEMHR